MYGDQLGEFVCGYWGLKGKEGEFRGQAKAKRLRAEAPRSFLSSKASSRVHICL